MITLIPVLFLLMVDAIIEVGFVGSMVGYLHRDHGGVPFAINSPAGILLLDPKPAHPIVNQGHTSNGAAGTAFVLGIIGCVIIWRQARRERMNNRRPSRVFLTWTIFAVLSALLTLSALIYTFIVTNQTDNQTISLATLAANSDRPYPADQWTPENWYKQVLTLPFEDESLKGDIRTHVHLMTGWRWNLIPLLVFGAIVAVLAVMNSLKQRRELRGSFRESGQYLRKEGP